MHWRRHAKFLGASFYQWGTSVSSRSWRLRREKLLNFQIMVGTSLYTKVFENLLILLQRFEKFWKLLENVGINHFFSGKLPISLGNVTCALLAGQAGDEKIACLKTILCDATQRCHQFADTAVKSSAEAMPTNLMIFLTAILLILSLWNQQTISRR